MAVFAQTKMAVDAMRVSFAENYSDAAEIPFERRLLMTR